MVVLVINVCVVFCPICVLRLRAAALLKGSKKPPQQQQQHQADDFAGETTTAAATFSNGSSSNDNNNHHGSSDETALAEYLNRIRLLEFDYNALHDKRLQDVSTQYIVIIADFNLHFIIRIKNL